MHKFFTKSNARKGDKSNHPRVRDIEMQPMPCPEPNREHTPAVIVHGDASENGNTKGRGPYIIEPVDGTTIYIHEHTGMF